MELHNLDIPTLKAVALFIILGWTTLYLIAVAWRILTRGEL